MWLLGAGASASAGVPTAVDMIWDFKQQLFVSQRRVSPRQVADLSSSVVRSQLQGHIDALGNLPKWGEPNEYAELFEAAYPDEKDRRVYIDSKVAGALPSYGHLALASLMKAKLTQISWTTNFDTLIADACAKIYGNTSALTSITLDAPIAGLASLTEGRWPVEVKLHGDFRSRRLKNTGDELVKQDKQIREYLLGFCHRFGLIVVGYSGRDDSVMDALEDALKEEGAYPSGLFWLHRGDDEPFGRVARLLDAAQARGVENALVRIDNFDELMRDLVRAVRGIDSAQLDIFGADRSRCSGAPVPSGNRGWPIVRLNAISVDVAPNVCRRVACEIGGYSEVRDAIASANANIAFARKRTGILAFGADSDMRKAFTPFGITDFDLQPIEKKRLRYDSAERGLLREAMTRAFVRSHNLRSLRRRNTDLLAPADLHEPVWSDLARLTGNIEGTVNGFPELKWQEGVGIRLDWADERLWLLIEPRLMFHGIDDANKTAAADFSRERNVKRYNRQLNELLNFWASFLTSKELRAFGIGDGVDAVFELSSVSGYSRSSGA
jgi:hypothetical protein